MRERNKYLHEQKLNEQLQGDGITLLGSSDGFDLYRITSYAGLSQFTDGDGNNSGILVGDAEGFANHINDNLHLYLVADSNTNHTVLGFLSNYSTSTLNVDDDFDFHSNLQFKDGAADSVDELSLNILKLIINHLDTEIVSNVRGGFIADVQNSTALKYYSRELDPQNADLDDDIEVNVPNTFTSIRTGCFYDIDYGIINIPSSVTMIERHSFSSDFEGVITFEVSEENAPSGDWRASIDENEVSIVFDANLSPEEREIRRAERERLATERAEAAERERIRGIIREFDDLVDEIPDTIVVTNDCKIAIDNALEYYDELADSDKQKVADTEEDELTKAQNALETYNRLKAERDERLNRNLFRYKLNKGEVEITYINPKAVETLGRNGTNYTIEIPDEIDGKPVVSILPYSFVALNYGADYSSSPTLRLRLVGGNNLKEIRSNAFIFHYTISDTKYSWHFENHTAAKLYNNYYHVINEPSKGTYETIRDRERDAHREEENALEGDEE